MDTKICNTTNNIIYYNTTTNQTQVEIYDTIKKTQITSFNLDAHLRNISNYYLRPDKYLSVINGIYPIPPKSSWLYNGKYFTCLSSCFVNPNYKPNKLELLNTIDRLLQKIKNKKICVELSGGLDTSLIIGILKHFNLNPILVGSKSDKYEFRTETIIQEKFISEADKHFLNKNIEVLTFSNLKSTPLHQLPSSTSLYHNFANKNAEKAKSLGAEIVLSGMGFDLVLCENPKSEIENTMPNYWHSWMLDDHWFNEYVYNKYDLTYKSALSSQALIKNIWTLRQFENEDLKKWWTRNFFKEFLPLELVNFAYKADNSGEFMDGFLNAKNEIADLYKLAFELTKNKEFSTVAFDKLYESLQLSDENKIKLILGRVSFANWIYGLWTNKLITA